MEPNGVGAKWRELNEAALKAESAARLAERTVTYQFSECANGKGMGPSEEQLCRAETLRKEADRCRNVEAAYLHGVFG